MKEKGKLKNLKNYIEASFFIVAFVVVLYAIIATYIKADSPWIFLSEDYRSFKVLQLYPWHILIGVICTIVGYVIEYK